ncbi:cell division protein [Ectothiorhodospiraceae bacterium WFHF3C12]|nr:cell division protein [Ectothiorhodospiraceae bacterium WFHF3C12]
MARQQPGRLRQAFEVYLSNHGRAALGALGRLVRDWTPSLMTAGVIGIALALPAAFLVLLDNLQSVTGEWGGDARASLFLHKDVKPEAYRELAQQLRGEDGVAAVSIIPPEEAMAEFQRMSGFSDALELLDENPLPPVLVVEIASGRAPAQIEALADRLGGLPQVARARLDRAWVKRLHAMMALIKRGIWVIAGLLALTVAMVVGNTIRLDIENRREEIVITKLIGGTDGFIRRPFLYAGLWYGLSGGLLACILVEAGRWLLVDPSRQLATLYGSGFRLHGLGLDDIMLLLACGAALGWAGSWLAVGRHLAAIEPR